MNARELRQFRTAGTLTLLVAALAGCSEHPLEPTTAIPPEPCAPVAPAVAGLPAPDDAELSVLMEDVRLRIAPALAAQGAGEGLARAVSGLEMAEVAGDIACRRYNAATDAVADAWSNPDLAPADLGALELVLAYAHAWVMVQP